MVGTEAKKVMQNINTAWLHPPAADRTAALASAIAERVTDL